MLRHIGLVSETSKVTAADLAAVAAAVQKQIVRDFRPVWDIDATVHAFPSLAMMPSDYVPVMVVEKLTGPMLGVHRGPNNQPYALVSFRPGWSVQVSHEILELLVDPTLDKLVAGPSLKPGQGRVNYLVEVCDPCQTDTYEINGVLVNDFCTREYFAPVAAPGVRYNFKGTIVAPRTIRPGGYLSWHDDEQNEWWMGFPFDGNLRFSKITPPAAALSLRELLDGQSRRILKEPRLKKRPVVSDAVRRASAARARTLRAHIAAHLRKKTAY